MGLPAQLVSRGLDCRQQLQCRRELRSFLLVRGLAGAQDMGAITVFRAPWPICSSFSLPLSSHIRISEPIRCSSFSSDWKRSPSNFSASGEPQSVEELWREYFADPAQWWDNRAGKRNPRIPDFIHKVTRKALWRYGWSTPPWVNAMLKLAGEGKMQPRFDYRTKDSQDTTQGDRLFKGHNGQRSIVPTTARAHMHIVQGGGGGMLMQGARTTIEAIDNIKNRLEQGMAIDSYMYVEVLRRCLKEKNLKVNVAKQVHDYINQSGLEQNRYVANNLMSVYIMCGELEDARGVFDKLVNKNVFSWTIMMGGYEKHNHTEEAMELFNQMCQNGVQPDAITFSTILKACANPLALQWGKEVHACVRHAGLESDVPVGNALVHMYVKCGSLDDARVVFERMEDRIAITWTIMIGGLAEKGCGREAYELFLQMQQEGFEPDAFTYANILNPSASAGALGWVKEVHGHALKAGLESDLRVGSALVHMYAKCGSLDDARVVFERMEDRDVITWTIMIGGLAEHGSGHEALEVFKTMSADGVKPNEISFVAVLSACSHSGLVDEGRRQFLAMTQDYGIEPCVVLCTCMVDVLARAGHLEEAKLLIDKMPVEANGATWGALLGACKTYCNVELGKLAANELLKLEPMDDSAYVLLSNIYAAAGKWGEVLWVRRMMQERGVHKEPGRSWIEVDNKVHDFVVGDTSHPEAKEIYAELRRLTETIKAEGYIPDTRLVLRNINEEEKELSLRSHSEKLAIAYGLMRTPPGERIWVLKNLRVCSDCHTATKFISKATKREIVVRDANRFHHFQDGACSCGDYW